MEKLTNDGRKPSRNAGGSDAVEFIECVIIASIKLAAVKFPSVGRGGLKKKQIFPN